MYLTVVPGRKLASDIDGLILPKSQTIFFLAKFLKITKKNQRPRIPSFFFRI